MGVSFGRGRRGGGGRLVMTCGADCGDLGDLGDLGVFESPQGVSGDMLVWDTEFRRKSCGWCSDIYSELVLGG